MPSERTYFVTSRPADRLSPLQILHPRRGQRGIEATCHQRLDDSLHEDQSRVRSPSGVVVLVSLRIIVLAKRRGFIASAKPAL